MRNYYCYDFRGNFVRAFDTAEQGAAWIQDQVRQWREIGRTGLLYRVCYNGHTSTEVARCVS